MGKSQLVNKIKIILIYSIYFRIFSFLYLNFRLLNFLGLHVATNFSQKKNRYPLANFILTRKRQYKLILYRQLETLAHRHHELAEMKASSRFHEYSEALRLQELLLVSKQVLTHKI
jgi:hypothetical protein